MSQEEDYSKKADVLCLKKVQIYGQLQRLRASLGGNPSKSQVEAALHTCGRLETAFETLTGEIHGVNVYLEKRKQIITKDFDSFENLFREILNICYTVKESNERVTRTRDEPKLPALSLPTWSGDISTWLNFKVPFDAMVHQRTDLKPLVKLQYLRASLRDEPLAIVSQYPVTDASYDLAYNDLINRYEDKRRSASNMLSRILDFKFTSSSRGHVQFFETHQTAFSALTQLEIDLDFIIFELSYRNLSPEAQRAFDLERTTNEIPRMRDLLTFVGKLAKWEELASDKPSSISTTIKIKSPSPTENCAIRTQPEDSLLVEKNKVCYSCKGNHLLYRCPDILALPVNDRRTKIENLGCCVACLHRHPMFECKSRHCCKICGSKGHNTIIHQGNENHQIAEASSSSESSCTFVEGKDRKSCNNCVSLGSGPDVLLGTLQCRIQDVWNRQISVRAILDPGSETSIITSSLANSLGLPKFPVTYQVEGIGSSLRKPEAQVKLKISSIHSPRASHYVVATVLPKISDRTPKSKLSHDLVERFKSLELADPRFGEPEPVHLLLGVDIWTDLISCRKSSIIAGSPTAIRTTFGYVIMGRLPESSTETSNSITSLFISTSSFEQDVKRIWEIEEVNQEIQPEPEDVLSSQKHSSERLFWEICSETSFPPRRAASRKQ